MKNSNLNGQKYSPVERKQEKQMHKVLDFVKKNYKWMIQIVFGLFLFYWLIFFLTPKIRMSEIERNQMDSLNTIIKSIHENQLKLDSSIGIYNKEIELIDDRLQKIKSERTIIKEIYHEEIDRVSSYTDYQLDSFFAKRYGYNPR
jgi:exonuclease VII small subunit